MRLRHVAVAIPVVAVISAAFVTWLVEDTDVRVLAYLVLAVGTALAVGLLLVWSEQRRLRREHHRAAPQPADHSPTRHDDGVRADLDELRDQMRGIGARLPEGASPLVTRSELHARTSWLLQKVSDTITVGTRQTDALLNLHGSATPRVPLVPSDGWAAAPDLLALLVHLVAVHQPPVVVELGSGTSSLWLGYAVERYGGRVVSLDHDPRFAQATRGEVEIHDLAATVEVRHAPLVEVTVGDWAGRYYDLSVLHDVARIDLLVVDGPPGDLQTRSREPAVPLLAGRLAPGAQVVLDDAGREDESAIVASWVERDGLELARHYRHFASRPALLRRRPAT